MLEISYIFNLDFDSEYYVYYHKLVVLINILVCFYLISKNDYKFNTQIFYLILLSIFFSKITSIFESYILYNSIYLYVNRMSIIYLIILLYLIFFKHLNPILIANEFLVKSFVIVWIIGKFGCFVLGDSCCGKCTDFIFGIQMIRLNKYFCNVHPVQLYDMIFGAFLLLLNKLFLRLNFQTHIKLFFLFIIISFYGFSIEFIRINKPIIFNLTINQIMYLIIFICNIYFYKLFNSKINTSANFALP